MDHMIVNNLLSDKQFGFMTGRSVLLQLLIVIDKWLEAMDRGNYVDVV